MKFLSRFILMIAFILCIWLYALWDDAYNSDNWAQSPIYSIRLKGELWEKSDFYSPYEKGPNMYMVQYAVAIPHRYQLKLEAYTIDVEIRPIDHRGANAFQVLTIPKIDGQILRVESSWDGGCGLTGLISEMGMWDDESQTKYLTGQSYFTDPKAIGFLWGHYARYCQNKVIETIEQVSAMPLMLKIYDGENLIGEEQIAFEIFKNGIKKHPPAY